MSDQITKDLGGITAYAAAVAAGYTGTKAQFETLMASYATVAQNAAASATAAASSKSDAEAYAVGKRNGTDVGSSDATYHNNSKYYAEQAEAFADSIDPDTLAKIDGYYDTLGAGTAEQLTSNIYEEDSVPYNFRTSGGSIDIGDRETDMIVGGTVAWNQLAKQFVINGSTISVDGTTCAVTHNGESRQFFGAGVSDGVSYVYKPLANHKYFWSVNITNISVANLRFITFANGFTEPAATIGFSTVGIHRGISKGVGNTSLYFNANMSEASTSTADTFSFKDMILIDLTQMFGSTIADYIYSLEQATAGAGVAWFKKLFPKYYEYNAGELMSVNASSHDMVGFNAWDEEWELGWISSAGSNRDASDIIRSKNYIPVIPNTQYYFNVPDATDIIYFDSDKTAIGNLDKNNNGDTSATSRIRTTHDDCHYIRFWTRNQTTYNNDICINLSWDGERDGEYEAYVKHSYPLDSSLTLRGIPKLDANNNLYYDGDTYESDGTVTRKYGVVMLDGSTDENWAWSTDGTKNRVYCYGDFIPNLQPSSWNLVSDKLIAQVGSMVSYPDEWKMQVNATPVLLVGVPQTITSADAWRAYLASNPITIVYELATPTTETADAYTNPQIVNDFGTEEYVDYAVSQGDRDVSIPVGHYTQYMANLKAKLEMSPNSPEGAGDYIVRQTNGENEYVSLASNATIQDIIARLEALEGDTEGGGE